ncbi:hypothetical protein LTR37_000390 [Vermiconidia calcicola]|uniref:Uncharacterized protein n=1 Tax=Vermiconidia calcicola TaxID=1690605 RepID=A0ACC3NYP9_9PEZI|nr:hypothetical protein LTR37_000390 [Vermiconidia calcicola]
MLRKLALLSLLGLGSATLPQRYGSPPEYASSGSPTSSVTASLSISTNAGTPSDYGSSTPYPAGSSLPVSNAPAGSASPSISICTKTSTWIYRSTTEFSTYYVTHTLPGYSSVSASSSEVSPVASSSPSPDSTVPADSSTSVTYSYAPTSQAVSSTESETTATDYTTIYTTVCPETSVHTSGGRSHTQTFMATSTVTATYQSTVYVTESSAVAPVSSTIPADVTSQSSSTVTIYSTSQTTETITVTTVTPSTSYSTYISESIEYSKPIRVTATTTFFTTICESSSTIAPISSSVSTIVTPYPAGNSTVPYSTSSRCDEDYLFEAGPGPKHPQTSQQNTQPNATSKPPKHAKTKPVPEADKQPAANISPQGSAPIPLTGANIGHALSYAALFLKERKQRFRIVMVNPEAEILRQKSMVKRAQRLVLFGAESDGATAKSIALAMEYAQSNTGVPLVEAWLNKAALECFSEEHIKYLKALSEHNDDVVFTAPGLQVVAVPLSYTFVDCACRLETEDEKAQDFEHAVDMLDAIVEKLNGKPVLVRNIEKWCAEFGKQMPSDRILGRVNGRYEDVRHRKGIYL